MKQIILIKEGPIASLIKDAGTGALFLTLIGCGVLLGSSALQWVGAFIGFTFIIVRAKHPNNPNVCTIEEARKRLDEIEAEQGRG